MLKTVKDCVQSCRFSQNEQKNNNCVFIFHTIAVFCLFLLTADDVQDVLHNVQDRT